jgi:hypothetical protein
MVAEICFPQITTFKSFSKVYCEEYTVTELLLVNDPVITELYGRIDGFLRKNLLLSNKEKCLNPSFFVILGFELSLVLTRQALYHLCQAPIFFCFLSYFSERVSCFYTSWSPTIILLPVSLS